MTEMCLGTKEGNLIQVSLGIGTKYLKASRNLDNYSLSLAFCPILMDSDTLTLLLRAIKSLASVYASPLHFLHVIGFLCPSLHLVEGLSLSPC